MDITYTQNNRVNIIGLEEESKPTEDIVNGSTFLEVDTATQFMFYEGAWYQQSPQPTE